MASFRKANLREFLAMVETIHFTPALQKAWGNLDHGMIFRGSRDDIEFCAIHDGDLDLGEDFQAPAHYTLIRGNLIVDGVVDTNCADMDEGGCFIVTGNVRSMVFLNHYGKACVVGGDLAARELLVNAFEDSLLYVGGAIRTHFYYGWDIWAEFGTMAEMDYGIGYCLPLNYANASAQAVRPRFTEAASCRYLAVGEPDRRVDEEIVALVKSGRPLFRS